MASLSTGLKEKLTISQCIVSKDGKIEVSGQKFAVMMNPSSFSHDHSISYSNFDAAGKKKKKDILGKAYEEPKFASYNVEKLSLNLVLDGTGVVEPEYDPVKTQVEKLRNVIYKYVGTKHEPSIVRLSWGSFIFDGRLDSMKIEYTLFKPSGEPLRAKIALSFGMYMSKEEETLVANTSSPDLSHIVEVRAGDTLPLLCYRIYKDSFYYAEVAKANNVVNFRSLKPGTRLEFPPLR